MAAAAARVAIIGGGWAGLAAAVEATSRGHGVTLFEMASAFGGRARRIDHDGLALDNGQHILIGAYAGTLRMMALVGADPQRLLWRMPLSLAYPDGGALTLPRGAPSLAFARAVLARRGWPWRERLALLVAAAGWARRAFRCDEHLTVGQLTAGLPATVRADLIDPLCIAALNTPAPHASASVFLRVLHDALLSGPGSADLLMPRVNLGAAFPEPALRWLARTGATVRLGHRVDRIEPHGAAWQVDGDAFDHVVLAATAPESARLAGPLAPAWAHMADALAYEPIVTVYVRSAGTVLPAPMVALRDGPGAPAQFAFDRGQLGGPAGQMAFVISSARAWVEAGLDATVETTLQQARGALAAHLRGPLEPIKALTEKRATFRCTPGLQRPAMIVSGGLHAAGDYVDGPYPATLEGAVRSGVAAVARQRA